MIDPEVTTLWRSGDKIKAIKRHRELTGDSLMLASQKLNSELDSIPPLPKATATCSRCGNLLRTDKAKQCFTCGFDWH